MNRSGAESKWLMESGSSVACSVDFICSGEDATDLPNEKNQGLMQIIGR